jgi:hypothetical protein
VLASMRVERERERWLRGWYADADMVGQSQAVLWTEMSRLLVLQISAVHGC